jgi:lysophospholipase L1-like esterase
VPSGPAPLPQLSATSFLAFGDSITAGVLGSECPSGGGVNCFIPTLMTRSELRLHLQRLFTNAEATSAAYPRALQSLLAPRYTTQSVAIANEGLGGEFVADGKNRLPGSITTTRPQVLLLQEGANDMNQPRPPTDAIVEDLRAMVREARGRGLAVFVGTLLPQRQAACRGYDFCDGVNDTVTANAKIRTMVTAEGAFLVDLHQGFEGQTTTLLGLDGLHPNEAGYQKMAEMFFEAIRQRLEGPQ